MKVEQLSVFIENKSGRLAEITGILGDSGVNIRALSLADTSDFGILRLIVDDVEKADLILRKAGFTVRKTTVVAVEVPDSPGGLSTILQALDESRINVEYMYAFVEPRGSSAMIIFRFDEAERAIKALSSKNFNLLDSEQLRNI